MSDRKHVVSSGYYIVVYGTDTDVAAFESYADALKFVIEDCENEKAVIISAGTVWTDRGGDVQPQCEWEDYT